MSATARVGLLAPTVLMLLAACADLPPPRWGSSAAAIQEDLRRESDVTLTSAHPELMSRTGAVLTVKGRSFADKGDCRAGDCIRFRADAVWRNEHVGINVHEYEEADYLLIADGDDIPLGSRPIPSPSGRRFFTGHHDDRRWSPNQGAAVWEWEPHPRRLRIVDPDLVVFQEFVAWRGDGCVEFIGARGFNVAAAPTRTFWLAEQHGDWQLLEERPPTCR